MSRRLATVALALTLLAVPASSAQAVGWVAHSLNFPSGINTVSLLGVGCSSTTTCMAVGKDGNTSSIGGAHAEAGAGSGWVFQTGVTRNPGPKNGVLNGSSCPTTTWCMTAGSYGNSGGKPALMAQTRNGSTWTLDNLGIPSGATQAEFNGVSCTVSTFCAAVGYKTVSGDSKPFAMAFNGSTWVDTGAITATNATLKGVSCPTSTYCVAVGSTGGSALAEAWSGGSWITTSAVAVPAGGSGYQLNSISCRSVSWCLAVGTYVSGGFNRAMASLWNGALWSSVPNLPASTGVSPIAYGVSCVTTTHCFAVGTSSGQPFADTYDGSTWATLTPLSVPAGATGGELRGISCVSAVHCEASGWSLFGGTPTGLIETYS